MFNRQNEKRSNLMEATPLQRKKTFTNKLCVMALMIGMSVVLQLYLRIPGFSPMQHFFNVVCAVFLGPWYSLVCAILTATLRMSLFAVTPLALTGSVFGAFLSGFIYRRASRVPRTARYALTAAGEIVGTGVIGAIVSWPVMILFLGNTDGALFGYVPAWLISTSMGSVLGLLLLYALASRNLIGRLQRQVGNPDAEK
jgi:energy coupling factor transporter S component ThiW